MIFTRGAYRRLDTTEKTIYLTFDDGPCPQFTPAVLDCLAENNARATFFLIADKAVLNTELVGRIKSAGHAIGNHSLDHRYRYFFGGTRRLREWIARAEEKLHDVSGAPTVGFRPPAGVCTPELHEALRDLKLPLILWNTRFYDKTLGWKLRDAQRTLNRLLPGSIVLLHDARRETDRPGFLQTLQFFLRSGREKGYHFRALPTNLLESPSGIC